MGTLIVQSSKDTYISEGEPNNNYGVDVSLRVYDAVSWTRRSILNFDISSLPENTEVISAVLLLYYAGWLSANSKGKTIWAYKLFYPDWVESQATWNIYETGSSWSAAGGDYITENPIGTNAIIPDSPGVWMSWDILNIVKDARDLGISVNLLLKLAIEQLSSEYSGASFRSNNYITDPSLQPKLIIEHGDIIEGSASGSGIGSGSAEGLLNVLGQAEGNGEGSGEVLKSIRIRTETRLLRVPIGRMITSRVPIGRLSKGKVLIAQLPLSRRIRRIL